MLLRVDHDYRLVTVSTLFYWYMIQAGLALIAACLPSFRFLLSKKSLQTVIHSFRSVVSLKSTSSRETRRYTDIESKRPFEKATKIYGQEDMPMQTKVVGGVSESIEMQPSGGISVQHGLSQTREYV